MFKVVELEDVIRDLMSVGWQVRAGKVQPKKVDLNYGPGRDIKRPR